MNEAMHQAFRDAATKWRVPAHALLAGSQQRGCPQARGEAFRTLAKDFTMTELVEATGFSRSGILKMCGQPDSPYHVKRRELQVDINAARDFVNQFAASIGMTTRELLDNRSSWHSPMPYLHQEIHRRWPALYIVEIGRITERGHTSVMRSLGRHKDKPPRKSKYK